MALRPQIKSDADAQQFLIVVIDDTTGSLAPGFDSILIRLGDLANADGMVRTAEFRWLYWKDANNGCASMRAKVLMTAPEPDPTNGGGP